MSATELAGQLERLRDQQRAVSDVLRAVTRSEGLQPVLDEIVESATRLCIGDNGRLWLRQGDLLHAFAVLAREGRRFRALICGDGPLRPALEALRAELGLVEVRLLGSRRQTELLALLGGADLFALVPVIASDGDRDGVPNVLVEAMACGLPVVSTAVGGVPDLVQHEENGLLAPPGDVEAIAGHIGRLLDDAALRHGLGASARRTVEQRFDVRAAALELAGVFGAGRREAM